MIDQITLHCRTIEKLGVSVTGVVSKTEGNQINQFVALKLLPLPVSTEPVAPARFRINAAATSALHYPYLKQSNLNPGRGGRAWM
jgi:hypothetical protein